MRHGRDFSTDGDRGFPALTGLALATVLLSLLPILVVGLQLLPAYSIHSRFLIFYAPLVCFLMLGYLLYIREVLARIMFGRVLEVPEPDPYYPEGGAGRGRILTNRLVAWFFNLLPALLLAASLYCVSRYVVRFNDSVAIASGVLASRIPSPLPGDSSVAQPHTTAVPGGVAQRSPEEALRRLPGLATDPNPLRTYTLTTAMIDDIPHFAELTALYIGGIVCPLAAVLLVLLKEYARSVLKLREEEGMGGGMAEDSEPQNFEVVASPRRPEP